MTSRSRLAAAALLLAQAPLAAQAAKGDFQLRYGLDEAAFRTANAEMFGNKLLLVDIAVAEVSGRASIAAIWQRFEEMPAATPELTAQMQSRIHLRQTAAELQATIAALGPTGSRVEVIDGYDVDGRTYYASAYCPPSEDPVQAVGLFLDNDGAAALRTQAQEKGYDLLRLEVAAEGKSFYYFPTFVERGESEIDAIDADNELGFLANRVKMDLAGMVPLSITMFRNENGHPAFVGMFDKGSARRELLINEPLADFRDKIDPLVEQGALVFDVDSFVVDGELRYSAVLMRPADG